MNEIIFSLPRRELNSRVDWAIECLEWQPVFEFKFAVKVTGNYSIILPKKSWQFTRIKKGAVYGELWSFTL